MAERHLYGLIGEFVEPSQAVSAARRLRGDGVRRFELYSPLPIQEMEPLLSSRPRLWMGLIMFAAACAGAVIGYFMQYAVAVIAYPLNVGGRPLDSWPAFIPIAWEICALFTVYLGFLALLAFCRLPRLYHPIFAAPGFERASRDRIFLCVEAADENFDVPRLSASFRAAGAVAVREVPV